MLGGYLIRALKSVLKQRDAGNFDLNQLIAKIGNETLRLVKGEKKKCKNDWVESKAPARQIIRHESCILHYVFFGKQTIHQFKSAEEQFRYNKYLDTQRKQLNRSCNNYFKESNSLNEYVLTLLSLAACCCCPLCSVCWVCVGMSISI